LRNAEIKADDGKEAAEERGPDHGPGPQQAVGPQRLEIQPMRNGAKPVPEPLRRRGAQHDAAGSSRHIEHRAVRIVKGEAEDRLLLAKAVERPLVFIDFLGGGKRRRLPVHARRRRERDGLGIVDVEALFAALHEVDRLDRYQHTGQAQHRRAQQHLDLGAGDRLGVGQDSSADPAASLPRDRRQAAQALSAGRLWKAHIHHDDAGGEPHQHQEAHCDPEIAVSDDQCPPPTVGDPCRHPCHPHVCDPSALKAAATAKTYAQTVFLSGSTRCQGQHRHHGSNFSPTPEW
jgi:hypothetical protein